MELGVFSEVFSFIVDSLQQFISTHGFMRKCMCEIQTPLSTATVVAIVELFTTQLKPSEKLAART